MNEIEQAGDAAAELVAEAPVKKRKTAEPAPANVRVKLLIKADRTGICVFYNLDNPRDARFVKTEQLPYTYAEQSISVVDWSVFPDAGSFEKTLNALQLMGVK